MHLLQDLAGRARRRLGRDAPAEEPGVGPAGAPPPAPTRDDAPFSVRVLDIDVAEAPEHPAALAEVRARDLDVVLLRGVLSPDEVTRAVDGLNAVRDEAGEEMFGHVLGLPLMRLGNDVTDRSEYYEATRRARATYQRAFGFDPHERIGAAFEQIADGLPVSVPEEAGGRYNPGTVRWYLPGQGGLYPHAGNEFVDQNASGALTHLLSVNPMREWISWFMVLQRPDSGGELTIYDLLHAERPPEIDHDAERRAQVFSTLRSQAFDPGPGDVIAFCGGWRYHRVEEIGPGRPRITYGGFMRPDHRGERIHVWA